ncbi:MAG: tRNA (adenosine(37)-N6)-threonylcarbamoyltransferase complex ATPase subunit type 1 TsaE [Alistipes sp.]|jgi:tRNA threonylcarbamoyladenosine biosynthesis protein TsaE|nr:tRNA (adenosine(37)-N6)-threonylcarbamoyltransferase complex ATPase subunit type 1 TsaE [Alistipes sp.]MBQ2416227.1 tRNA (adenosine(37)-N6)-threonylcarbamoyltransferase complex ATPase subunit type 1 TsaE [Alistipes sp.]MBQ5623548.1 tRNA (adenosine(37)-N6)-threonylcarbamoyltransferase complex ATPase subunit type 1 TsaE [Alistipes sp.]MBQ5913805.1 tRNA (adenosine(37)-N6)-threonylcarbamoyltransferase complex ATPase subunit type 1 TsaE [Alistipes sp.]MBR5801637.1 tRNA (adenosine(37)-N6)-threonyl
MIQLKIDSLSELDNVAEQIISSLDGRNVVLFRGGMGAGKTTLISRIVAQLGAEDTVTSPTFALVNEYEGADKMLIYHFDFYRIDKVEEVFDLGYEEYFYSGDLCLVEWPEKIEALIPDDVMTVKIEVEDDGQRIFTID